MSDTRVSTQSLCPFIICCFESSPRLLFLLSAPLDESPDVGEVGEELEAEVRGKTRTFSWFLHTFLGWFCLGRC